MDQSPLRRILAYLWRERRPALLAAVAAAGMAFCLALLMLHVGLLAHGLAPDALTAENIRLSTLHGLLGRWDDTVRWFGYVAPYPAATTYLFWALVMLATLVMARGVFRYLGDWAAAVALARATGRLRRDIYNQAYKLGDGLHGQEGAAQAIDHFTRSANQVERAMRGVVVDLFREPLAVVGILTVALLVEPLLALLGMALALLGWVLVWTFRAKFERQQQEASEKPAHQLAILQESMFGMRVVKSLGMEAFEHKRFFAHMDQFRTEIVRADRVAAMRDPFAVFWGVVGVAVYLGVAGYNILNGQMTLAAAACVTAAIVSLYWPVRRLLKVRGWLPGARMASANLCAYLDAQPEVDDRAGTAALAPLSKSLCFEHMAYRTQDGQSVLEDVELEIRAGERVAVVGINAFEKRCLVNILLRLLEPASGCVRIDGEDIRATSLASFRTQVALVPHDNPLFNDTVRNNMAGGDAKVRPQDLADAAKMAHAHHFIQGLEKGYETVLGDGGVSLNLGERFRLALARAILRQPSLLVVEEPAAPFDEESSAMIDDAINRFAPGRTVVTVAHRESTVREADRVVVLHRGRVAAVGSHAELAAGSELYRHILYTELNVMADDAAQA